MWIAIYPDSGIHSLNKWDKVPVSQKSHNFSSLFRVPQFPLYLCNAIKLCNPLDFSYVKNRLKDQLFKTSGLQFDNWLFRPEKFSGLFRNRPLV